MKANNIITMAVSLTFIGLGVIFVSTDQPFFGVPIIIFGILINPVYFTVQEAILGRKAKWYINTLIPIAVLAIGISIGVTLNSRQDNKADAFLNKAHTFLEAGNTDSAMVIIEKAKPMYSSPTANAATELEKDINNALDPDYARWKLTTMNEQEFEAWNTNPDTHVFFSNSYLNTQFNQLLQEHAKYRAELIAAEAEKKDAEERKQKVKDMFNSWDGSHRGLVKFLKANMNDPSSFEHVKTTYNLQGDEVYLVCTFRGKNAFGGLVLNTVTAKSDLNGNIIEIISND